MWSTTIYGENIAMNSGMESSESVNTLVTKLCKNFLESTSSSVATEKLHLLKLKSVAYRILLYKAIKSNNPPLSAVEQLSTFGYGLKKRGHYALAMQLEHLVSKITEHFENHSSIFEMEPILILLLRLADKGSQTEKTLIGQNVWSDIVNNNWSEDTIYPHRPPVYGNDCPKNSYFYMHFPVSVFEDVTVLEKPIENKVKFSTEIFEAKPGLDTEGNHLLCSFVEDESSYSKMTRHTLFHALQNGRSSSNSLNMRLEIPELPDAIEDRFDFQTLPRRTYKLSQGSEGLSEDEGFLDQDYHASTNQVSVWDNILNVKPNLLYTWETIGRYDSRKEKPFVSEAGPEIVSKLHLLIIRNLRLMNPSLNYHLPEPVLVKQSVIVADLLNLMVGIQSENFYQLGENFLQRPGLHILGLTPDSTAALIAPLLFTAQNFLKLSSMSTDFSSLHHQGFVSQAFKLGICQYLSCYQASVMMLKHDVSIMELCFFTEKLRNQLDFLTRFCKLKEDDQDLPSGIDLLTHIYKTCVDNWHSEYYSLLLFLLRVSCRPYFRFLQDWLFEGKCEDLFGEYMIQADDTFLSYRDRSYWTNGYVLLQSSGGSSNVPIFLQNLGIEIFLCGKSLNLLKLCNPKHGLCRIDRNLTPSFALKFSERDLKQLDQKCHSYSTRILDLTQETSSNREHNMLIEKQDKHHRAILAKQQAEESFAKIAEIAMQNKKNQYEKKKLQLETLKLQMEEDICRRQKTKKEEAIKDIALAEKAKEERQRLIIQEKHEMEMKRKKIMKDAEVNKQLSLSKQNKGKEEKINDLPVLRDKSRIQSSSDEVRMSITEDDDGQPVINLNLLPENSQMDVRSQSELVSPRLTLNLNSLYNATNVINDSRNSNVPFDVNCETDKDPTLRTKNVDWNRTNLVQQRVIATDEQSGFPDTEKNFLFGDSPLKLSKRNVKNFYGHPADADIQTLIYQDNQNQNMPCETTHTDLRNLKNVVNQGAVELELKSIGFKGYSDQTEPLTQECRTIELVAKRMHKSNTISSISLAKVKGSPQDGEKEENADNQSDMDQSQSVVPTDELDSQQSGLAMNDSQSTDQLPKDRLSSPPAFCYQKSFPELDSLPDLNLMKSVIPNTNKEAEDEKDVQSSLNMPLSVLIHRSLIKPVSLQVTLVNKSIVDYFLVELQINEHFHALRNFLFLHDGEFGHMLSVQLFEAISNCSLFPTQVLNPITLNNLLSTSLSSSLHGHSVYADNLSFIIKPSYTTSKPNVFSIMECLQLNYQVQWPLNIIITEKDIIRYNKIFAFIIQVKYTVWALNDIFCHLKRQTIVGNLDTSPQFRQLQIYRHEMQHFARVLQSYIVSQVLQATWQEFQETLKTQVHNIDELRHAHSTYLNKACFRCLQNEKAAQVIKIVKDIFALILKFQAQLVSYPWLTNPENNQPEHPKFQLLSKAHKDFHEYAEFLCKVLRMLAFRGYQPHLYEFLLRLDFNNFYENQMVQ